MFVLKNNETRIIIKGNVKRNKNDNNKFFNKELGPSITFRL